MSERETALKEQKRPTEAEIDMLEKVAWDANVDGVLVWERDQRERLQTERDGYRGALVGLLPLLYGHPEILRKRINQALAGADPVPVCQWREIATAPKDGTRFLAAHLVRRTGEWYQSVVWWEAQLRFADEQDPDTPDIAWRGGWVDGSFDGAEYEELYPTHWMPLPAPPVALVPAEGEKP